MRPFRRRNSSATLISFEERWRLRRFEISVPESPDLPAFFAGTEIGRLLTGSARSWVRSMTNQVRALRTCAQWPAGTRAAKLALLYRLFRRVKGPETA
jgi:hypothetical protein